MPVTYDIIQAVDNGSQFFNANLHVHSSVSLFRSGTRGSRSKLACHNQSSGRFRRTEYAHHNVNGDVINKVEEQGGICIAAHIDRVKTGFEMVVAGYPNWKRDVMLSSGLYGIEFDET